MLFALNKGLKSGVKCVLATACPHCRKHQDCKGWAGGRNEDALVTQHAQKCDRLSEAWQHSPWLEHAIAKGANSNLRALGLINSPSTFFSLRTLLVLLVVRLAVFPPRPRPWFLSAALAQLKVAGSALPGVEMAQDGLGTRCHANAPSRQQCLLGLIAFSQGRALWGNSKSLPHCSFCLLFGEGMKASVVSWPIILITFGHEAWLK